MYIVAQEAGELLAYEAHCWLEEYVDCKRNHTPDDLRVLRCWSWKFDGALRKTSKDFKFGWTGSRREMRPIQGLTVYPLRYGKENLENELHVRGEKLWSCRNMIHVSYDDEDIFGDPVQVSYPHFQFG
jgi:hypothetical protein